MSSDIGEDVFSQRLDSPLEMMYGQMASTYISDSNSSNIPPISVTDYNAAAWGVPGNTNINNLNSSGGFYFQQPPNNSGFLANSSFQNNLFNLNHNVNIPDRPPSPQTDTVNFGTSLNGVDFFPQFIPLAGTQFSQGVPSQQQQHHHQINKYTPLSSHSSSTSSNIMSMPTSPNLPPSGFTQTVEDSNSPTGIRILIEPKEYQIVNYNIYPAPEIEFNRSFSTPVTVQAFLMFQDDSGNVIDIPEGFTNGDVQVLKVGQTKVSFPALHLNRMTPIKNVIQHTGLSIGPNFRIVFKINDTALTSHNFKLVSACTQIPEGMDGVRPRVGKGQKDHGKGHRSEFEATSPLPSPLHTPSIALSSSPSNSSPLLSPLPISPIQPTMSSTLNVPKMAKTASGSKRRASEEQSQELFLHVRLRGETEHRGFIAVHPDATLRIARMEIGRSPSYPKNFRFWFERMQTIVQLHQEDQIKAAEAVDGTCLVLEPYDVTMENIDSEVVKLWTMQDVPEPLVQLNDLVRTLSTVYNKNNSLEPNDMKIVVGGIIHFLANITKNRERPGVGMEDFKLFLKFFGPAQECLHKVFSVYREPFFHGFARHADAVELLKGRPGYFLVRYSESQLKDGFFAFNVNKGNSYRDVIENYSIRYDTNHSCFMFRDKSYKTLRDFILDPEYSQILRHGLTKTTTETIKESNYRSATDLISS